MGEYIYSDYARITAKGEVSLCVAQSSLFQNSLLLLLSKRVFSYWFTIAMFILLFINATPALASMSRQTIDITSFSNACRATITRGKRCIHWDKDALYNGWLVSGSSPPDETATGSHGHIPDTHTLLVAISSSYSLNSEENAIGNMPFVGESDGASFLIVDTRMSPSETDFMLVVIFGVVTSGVVVYKVRQRAVAASRLIGYVRMRTMRQRNFYLTMHPRFHPLLKVIDNLNVTATIIRPPDDNNASEWYFIRNDDERRRWRYVFQAHDALLNEIPLMTVLLLRIEHTAEGTVLKFAATAWAVQAFHPRIHGIPMEAGEFKLCNGQEIQMGDEYLLLRLDIRRNRE